MLGQAVCVGEVGELKINREWAMPAGAERAAVKSARPACLRAESGWGAIASVAVSTVLRIMVLRIDWPKAQPNLWHCRVGLRLGLIDILRGSAVCWRRHHL